MRNRMPFQLELSEDSATLYLHGRLDRGSHAAVLEACAALPPSIRTLRLDLRALRVMTAEVTSVVRLLLTQWRDGGRGEFRLSASHLVAVCARVPTPERTMAKDTKSEHVRHPLALAPL